MCGILIIFILVLRDVFSTVVIEPPMLEPSHYCVVREPVYSYTFNFLGLSNHSRDSIIRLEDNEILRVHFCQTLVTACNGKQGYAVCLRRSNGEEVGVGREPPLVDFSSGKIMFKYTGDQCNKTHNYTANFEMKCDFSIGNQVAVDIDALYDQRQCDFHVTLDTLAACFRRKQTECSVTDETGHYNLSPLTDYSSNYEVYINTNLSVILNICHSLLFGEHYASCNYDTAVCLIDRSNQTSISYNSLGRLDEDSHVYIYNGHLQIDYTNGTLCNREESNKTSIVQMQSTISFYCDINATNSIPDYIGGLEYCNLRFRWPTIAACSEQMLHEHSLINTRFCAVKDPFSNYIYDLNMLKNGVFKSKNIQGDYEFSICNPLKRNICKPGSGLCRISVDKTYGVSGGLANGNLMWKDGGPYLNYTNGNVCRRGLRRYTVIAFFCGNDLSLDIEDGHCHTTINWTTDMICRKECAVSDNSISFQQLIRTSDNYVIKVNNNTVFHINVCRSLVPERALNCPFAAGICKATVDESGKLVDALSLGYPYQLPRLSSKGIVILPYENGSMCKEDHRRRTSSQISFLCDFTIKEGIPEYKGYYNCTYYFEWRTKLSCGKINGSLKMKESLPQNLMSTTTQIAILLNDSPKSHHETYTTKVFKVSTIFLIIVLILILGCYFRHPVRRAHFCIRVRHFIAKHNLCCKRPQPTEDLCL